MENAAFKGDKKLALKSPLARWERAFIDALTPHMPRWIEGYHLTLMTILWSGGVVLAPWLARENPRWLLVAAVMQFAQWFTDCFDGSLGRYRDTGIPKWGYYMDHFLDFVFMCAAIVGLALMLDGSGRFMMMLMIPLVVSFMVNSFLSFASTGEFKITFLGVGPTELRLFMIVVYLIVMARGVAIMEIALPYLLAASLVALTVVVFRSQKYIWSIDMADKAARPQKENGAAQPGKQITSPGDIS